MENFEKQEKDAAECDLVAQLTTAESKQKTFNNLANSYPATAAKMKPPWRRARQLNTH
jgi:type II secretory pathway component PulL